MLGKQITIMEQMAVLPDGTTQPIDMETFSKDHWLVLFFYPKDFTFV
jgi:alkyl hydroperoxide reductase subunit AhpC